MKLTAKLAYSQLIANRKRSIWTLLGIMLATAMFTAVFGFAASFAATIGEFMDDMYVRADYYRTIYGAGGILSVLIVIVSVVVVSNAFRVSAGERMSQFGLLKSVGATKKQIAQTVIYEGIFLSAVGIPAGLVLGMLVQVMGVAIANHMLTDLNALQDGDYTLVFGFVFAWQAVIVSSVLSFFTVLLSAWLPARRAAKTAAIDAIRGEGEVKIKARRFRGGFFVRKIFGFEGELAAKSLKRSRRNFRATVISLTVGIVLYIGASSFGSQFFRMTNLVFGHIEADVMAHFIGSRSFSFDDEGNMIELRYMALTPQNADQITAGMSEFSPDTSVIGVGGNAWRYMINNDDLRFTPDFQEYMDRQEWSMRQGMIRGYFDVTLLTVDAATYAEMARRAGVPLGSNILVNHARSQPINGNWTEFTPHVFTGQTLQMHTHDGEIVYLPLHGQISGTNVPHEISHTQRSYLMVIVPEVDATFYFWMVQTDDVHGFEAYWRDFLFDILPPQPYDLAATPGFNAGVFNAHAEYDAMRSLFHLIMTAIYGFVGMLILIGLTNVISTISTNIRSRSREFAVLQSAGMTTDGLKRMLNLESILCSAKALVFGLPLGVGVSFLFYMAIMESVAFPFEFPWIPIAQSIVAVFAITWITMRFAVSRLKGGSIVEKIRGEEVR
ncbi:MAG: ABC transporter permease [Defluviitaleaceae bacterium]|nr:ABC transporter permease [Defluviitaleaceae bacterium]